MANVNRWLPLRLTEKESARDRRQANTEVFESIGQSAGDIGFSDGPRRLGVNRHVRLGGAPRGRAAAHGAHPGKHLGQQRQREIPHSPHKSADRLGMTPLVFIRRVAEQAREGLRTGQVARVGSRMLGR